MSKEIALKSYNIGKPEEMSKMSTTLKTHVVKHKLYTEISGKNYVHVDGWAFAGGLMGLFPKVVNVENLSSGTETKWKAEVEIVNAEGRVMGTGFALCSNKESKKTKFDEYAILSMAQTRAIGKAYRNLVGWVMKLAGYESTPKEEMTKMGDTPKETPVKPIPQNKGKQEVIEDHVCLYRGCGTDITKQEAQYSARLYGKELCRDHQKVAKSNK